MVHIPRGWTALCALRPLNPYHQELVVELTCSVKRLMALQLGSEPLKAGSDPEQINVRFVYRRYSTHTHAFICVYSRSFADKTAFIPTKKRPEIIGPF